MTAKQTPLVDILRLHAEDLYSDYGHNKSARLLSQAADEIERLRSNSLALEDEKNDYMDGVGDVLRQDHDGETLWAAAQRVMSECDRLRAELAECRAILEKIADPVHAMQRELPEGARLNGAMAVALSNDPNYLKGLAKAGLFDAARKGEGAE